MGTSKRSTKKQEPVEEEHPRLAEAVIGKFLHVSIESLAGRFAARAYAYTLAAQGDTEMAEVIFEVVGREG